MIYINFSKGKINNLFSKNNNMFTNFRFKFEVQQNTQIF